MLATMLVWASMVASASAQGTGTSVSVQLMPTSIPADGVTTTTATATVDNAEDQPVSGETVVFSSTDTGEHITSTTDNLNGTYSVTITSSTTVGTPTITATDSSATSQPFGQAMLTQTDPANNVSVSLSPSSIPANGASSTTATATVEDSGTRINGATVTFMSTDNGETIGDVTPEGNGKYQATITSSTTVGTPIITATDTTAPSQPSDQRVLTQTDPANNVSVSVSPSSIPADGTSTTTATATVEDSGTPINGATVTFVSTDTGEMIGGVTKEGNGKYEATVTSSTTLGTPTITATDTSAPSQPSGQTTLTQTEAGSTTYLTTSPTSAVTNQKVTLVATVSSSSSEVKPSGSMTFYDGGTAIAGCASVSVPTSNPTATCQTSFSASTSPESLTAAFTAATGVNIANSTSTPDDLEVGKDTTGTDLGVSSTSVVAGTGEEYIALVTSSAGPAQPTGTVEFTQFGIPISSCSSQPLASNGLATCFVDQKRTGQYPIGATYSGDGNFLASSSTAVTIAVSAARPPVLGTIASTMDWSFHYTRSYTKVLRLVVDQAPIGARIVVLCRGKGCPFARHVTRVTKLKRCPKGQRGCRSLRSRAVGLTQLLRKRALRAGAQLTIEIVRTGWNGKYYQFSVRSGRSPGVRISCLAPGATRPGGGC